jgi:hypothetical protein
MNKPTSIDLFICARHWQEATHIAEAIAENRVALGARHTQRDEADKWCAKLNECLPPHVAPEVVYHIRVSRHYGPDCPIFNFVNIGG